MPVRAVDELPRPAYHDVDLVLGVWRLRVGPARRVDLYDHAAVPEHLGGTLPVRARQKLRRLRERELVPPGLLLGLFAHLAS